MIDARGVQRADEVAERREQRAAAPPRQAPVRERHRQGLRVRAELRQHPALEHEARPPPFGDRHQRRAVDAAGCQPREPRARADGARAAPGIGERAAQAAPAVQLHGPVSRRAGFRERDAAHRGAGAPLLARVATESIMSLVAGDGDDDEIGGDVRPMLDGEVSAPGPSGRRRHLRCQRAPDSSHVTRFRRGDGRGAVYGPASAPAQAPRASADAVRQRGACRRHRTGATTWSTCAGSASGPSSSRAS